MRARSMADQIVLQLLPIAVKVSDVVESIRFLGGKTYLAQLESRPSSYDGMTYIFFRSFFVLSVLSTPPPPLLERLVQAKHKEHSIVFF